MNRTELTMNRTNRMLGTTLAALLLGTVAATATAAPVMAVRINGQVIATNFEHVFADTRVGSVAEVVVVLRNEGAEALEFTEDPPIQMSGGFPDQFELIQPALETGNTLSPNGSTAFLVRFRPEFRFAEFYTHVYIWTNAGASPFHLVVSGKAVAPEMVVRQVDEVIPDGGRFDLPDTAVGETTEVEFVIENTGDAQLALTAQPLAFVGGGTDESMVQLTQQPEPFIEPGASTTFRLAFTPEEERTYSTRLFMYVNQDDASVNGLYDIDLVANGVAADVINDPGDGEVDGAADEDNNLDLPEDDGEGEGAGNVDEGDDGQFEEPLDPIEQDMLTPIGGLCGFGAGFASFMGLISLGGVRAGSRRFLR